jgi:hypothetical protein
MFVAQFQVSCLSRLADHLFMNFSQFFYIEKLISFTIASSGIVASLCSNAQHCVFISMLIARLFRDVFHVFLPEAKTPKRSSLLETAL